MPPVVQVMEERLCSRPVGQNREMRYTLPWLFAALAPALAQAAGAEATIEYVAHACFVIESPAGTRVAIDPYNTNRWLGYHFPDSLEADAVLVTHPHYDHDADYAFGSDVPVFRAPGAFALGDIQVRGFAGRHADPYGKEFGQRNTVWLIEVGGVRILHLGDNGPLTEELIEQIGKIDVLMPPVDDLEHILKFAEIAEIERELEPSVTIPMHYRIEAISELPKSVGPIDEWLAARPRVRRIETNRVTLGRGSLPQRNEVWALSPSPAVRAWGPEMTAAWGLRDRAREAADDSAAIELMARAHERAPEVMVFTAELAEALVAADRDDEALRLLEKALASAGRTDWEYTMRCRRLLAQLYRGRGELAAAEAQYRLILKDAYRLDWREKAGEMLSTR